MEIIKDKLEQIPCNKEKYEKSLQLKDKYGNVMFDLDALYNSGLVYKLPLVAYAGDLSDNCFVTFEEDKLTFFRFNGYLQPVFSTDYNNGDFKHINTNIPIEYIQSVRKFFFENIVVA